MTQPICSPSFLLTPWCPLPGLEGLQLDRPSHALCSKARTGEPPASTRAYRTSNSNLSLSQALLALHLWAHTPGTRVAGCVLWHSDLKQLAGWRAVDLLPTAKEAKDHLLIQAQCLTVRATGGLLFVVNFRHRLWCLGDCWALCTNSWQ